MNKVCPKCGQNFSEEFDECVYCGTALVFKNIQEVDNILYTSNDILSMTDEQILDFYKDYKDNLIRQGVCSTDEEFLAGIKQGNRNKRLSDLHNNDTNKQREGLNIPKCPTCQSTNIQKISGLERGTSVALFGLFSKKIGKEWHCKNCGYKW